MVTTTEKPIYADIAIAQLGLPISPADTTIALAAGQGERMPTPAAGEYAPAMIRDRKNDTFEPIEITARVGDTLTVRRGMGSPALAFEAGTQVYLTKTASEIAEQNRSARITDSETWRVLVGDTPALTVNGSDLSVTTAADLTVGGAASVAGALTAASLSAPSISASHAALDTLALTGLANLTGGIAAGVSALFDIDEGSTFLVRADGVDALSVHGASRQVRIPYSDANGGLALGSGQDLVHYHSGTTGFLLNRVGGYAISSELGNVSMFVGGAERLVVRTDGETRALAGFRANSTSGIAFGVSNVSGLSTAYAGLTVSGAEMRTNAGLWVYDDVGSPHIRIAGSGLNTWSIGANRSNDAFVISDNLGGPGTNDYLSVATSGLVSLSRGLQVKSILGLAMTVDGATGDVGFGTTGVAFDASQNGFDFPDSSFGSPSLALGDSSDLRFYHDGSDSFIYNATGRTIIQSQSSNLVFRTGASDRVTIDPAGLLTVRRSLQIEVGTLGDPLLQLVPAPAAGVAGSVTSWTSGNSIQGFFLAAINGVDRWVPYYDAPTS